MLSICTTIKNRSRISTERGQIHLFPECIKSLANSLSPDDDVELVIADWESNDWPIREWIENAIPHVPIHIITIKSESFSAGTGRNIAADNCNGDTIFFMDADMIVNRAVIADGWKLAQKDMIYYPTVKYEMDDGKQIIHEGGGNVFMSKVIFNKSGKWPEYWKHGFEDTDYVHQLNDMAQLITNNKLSIFHQWHPQTSLFKNAYASKDIEDLKTIEERKEYYTGENTKHPKIMITAIDYILKNNPHTTHSSLNVPVKGDNRSLAL